MGGLQIVKCKIFRGFHARKIVKIIYICNRLWYAYLQLFKPGDFTHGDRFSSFFPNWRNSMIRCTYIVQSIHLNINLAHLVPSLSYMRPHKKELSCNEKALTYLNINLAHLVPSLSYMRPHRKALPCNEKALPYLSIILVHLVPSLRYMRPPQEGTPLQWKGTDLLEYQLSSSGP